MHRHNLDQWIGALISIEEKIIPICSNRLRLEWLTFPLTRIVLVKKYTITQLRDDLGSFNGSWFKKSREEGSFFRISLATGD